MEFIYYNKSVNAGIMPIVPLITYGHNFYIEIFAVKIQAGLLHKPSKASSSGNIAFLLSPIGALAFYATNNAVLTTDIPMQGHQHHTSHRSLHLGKGDGHEFHEMLLKTLEK